VTTEGHASDMRRTAAADNDGDSCLLVGRGGADDVAATKGDDAL
jgi:hypothetical protein